jgi:hypothetical protein
MPAKPKAERQKKRQKFFAKKSCSACPYRIRLHREFHVLWGPEHYKIIFFCGSAVALRSLGSSCGRPSRRTIPGSRREMLANQRIWQKKREELAARRAALLESYAATPGDSGLALQLKIIDESIAQCSKNGARRAGAPWSRVRPQSLEQEKPNRFLAHLCRSVFAPDRRG